MAWEIKRFLGFTTLPAADLNQFRANLELLKLHTHNDDDGDGSAAVYTGLDYLQLLPFSPHVSSGWSTLTVAASTAFTGYIETNTAVAGQYIEWSVPLRNGTWRLDVLHGKGPAQGIYTVTLGALALGTIDAYAAADSVDNTSSLTSLTVNNFAVGTPQKLRFTISTKNASASAYRGRLQFLALRRTGA